MPIYLKVVDSVLFYVELVVALLLFLNKIERRRLWWLRIISCFVFAVGMCFVLFSIKDPLMSLLNTSGFNYAYFALSYGFSAFTQLMILVIFMFTVCFTFRVGTHSAIEIGCATFSMQNIARCVFTFYQQIVKSESVFPLKNFQNPLSIVIYLIIYFVIYGLCYFIFIKLYDKTEEKHLNKTAYAVLICIIISNIIISSVEAPKNSDEASALFIFVLFARILLCVTGLIMQFLMVNWLKTQYEQEQLLHIMKEEREQYSIAKDNMDIVKITAHDLRNQLDTLKKAINDSDNKYLTAEIEEMSKSIIAVDSIYQTGNKALDITVTEKSRKCVANNINLSVIADGLHLNFMSDIDIYSLFGNALDNAIEATQNIIDEENRVISFSMFKENETLAIHLENTLSGEVEFADGVPITSKKDKSCHGYGVKSIMRIVSKYEGNVKMRVEEGMFKLDIIFPLQ